MCFYVLSLFSEQKHYHVVNELGKQIINEINQFHRYLCMKRVT